MDLEALASVLIKRPWKGAYLFRRQFPRRRHRIMVSLQYLPYYWKFFNHILQLYTLGVGKFFHMFKLYLWSLSRSHDQKIVSKIYWPQKLVIIHTCSYYQKREPIRFLERSDEKGLIYEWFSHRYQPESLKFMRTPPPPPPSHYLLKYCI